MLHELSLTLEKLLKSELPKPWDQTGISFAVPDAKFPLSSVSLPVLNLFLYGVSENKKLRSNDWLRREGRSATTVWGPPPMRLDCTYFITAWIGDESEAAALDEQALLSEAMKVLARYPTLPEDMLNGSLKDQSMSLQAAALRAARPQTMVDVWRALGRSPKAAFAYTVTIPLEVSPAQETTSPRELILKIGQRTAERSEKGNSESDMFETIQLIPKNQTK